MAAAVPEIPKVDEVLVDKTKLKQALIDLRDLFANPYDEKGNPLAVPDSDFVEKSAIAGYFSPTIGEGSEKRFLDYYTPAELNKKLKTQATLKWEDSAANYAKRMVSSKADLKGFYRSAKYDNTGKLMNPQDITLNEIAKERDGAIRDRDWYKPGDQPRGYYPLLASKDENPGAFIPPRLKIEIPNGPDGNPVQSAVLLPINPNLSKYVTLSTENRDEYYAREDEGAILRLARIKYKLAEADAFNIAFKKKPEDYSFVYRTMQTPGAIASMSDVNSARNEYFWDLNQRGNLIYLCGYYHEYVRDIDGNLKYSEYQSSIWDKRFTPATFENKDQTTVGASAPISASTPAVASSGSARRSNRLKSRRNNIRNVRSTRKSRK